MLVSFVFVLAVVASTDREWLDVWAVPVVLASSRTLDVEDDSPGAVRLVGALLTASGEAPIWLECVVGRLDPMVIGTLVVDFVLSLIDEVALAAFDVVGKALVEVKSAVEAVSAVLGVALEV